MFYTLLITYILGGITFLPLLLLLSVAFAFYTADPVRQPNPTQRSPPAATEENNASPSSAAHHHNPRTSSFKSWLTVRRTFEPSPSSYISIVRTLLDARSSHPRRAEDAFYAVLKGKVLYLYEDEAMSECAAAIDVGRCSVRVFPDAGLLDGELFAKRNAILIREKEIEPEDVGNLQQEDTPTQPPQPAPWYIFFRSVTDMEDWYLALLSSSLLDSIPPDAFAPYPHTAHQALLNSLDALPDLIPTRWLNALLGRLFLGVKGTKAVENWVVGRLMKKLSKVKTPGFLSRVVVRSFDAGDVAPVLSKPMLKELTPEGEAGVGVDVSYVAPPGGGMRITVSATATISLPTTPSLSLLGFNSNKHKDKDAQKEKEKPYEVSLVLAVIVRRVEGNVLFKIKRPPSNRLWYAFTTMPHMEVSVEPVVSDRQIRWGMVLSAIEGKLKEIIQESVVLPYMDDIPFFDTTSFPLRGGIFADAFAAPSMAHPSEPHTTASTAATASASDADKDHDASAPPADCKDDSEASKRIHRTRSVEVLIDKDGGGDQATGPPEPDVGMARAATLSGDRGAGSVRKRRTWFGGRKSEEEEEGNDPGEHRRGRSEEGTGTVVKVLVTENEGDAKDGDATTNIGVGEADGPVERPMISTRRTHGSRSVSDATYAPPRPPTPPPFSASTGLSTSAPSASSPTASSAPGSVSPPPSASNTGSFFSTLKSRGAGMAEKQPAIKEAMRKWGVGVNWAAGLRKGDGHSRDVSGNSSRERGREREREDEYGDMWGMQDDSGRGASPRGSYADLRKKVEMRERERMGNASDSGSVAGNGSGSSSGTRPIDIPGVGGRELDVSPERRTLSSRSDTSSTRKLSPPGGALFLTPSAPRTTTELHTSARTPSPTPHDSRSSTPPRPHTPERRGSDHGRATVFPSMDDSSAANPPKPIRAQPKAATMTIPGIHASHKNEVMGFGYVPPQPESSQPQAPTSGGSGSAGEGSQVTTGKTIQSVYRLLRGGSAGLGAGTGTGDSGETVGDEAKSRTTAAIKPNPPPLPPRTPTQPVGISDTLSSSASPLLSGDVGDISQPSALSPASQALKSVVEQDAARKPPPLPVRRPSLSPAQTPRTSSSGRPSSMSSSPSPSTATSPSALIFPSSSATSDQDGASWLHSNEIPASVIATPLVVVDEKWKPPLPPRKSSASLRHTESVAG